MEMNLESFGLLKKTNLVNPETETSDHLQQESLRMKMFV